MPRPSPAADCALLVLSCDAYSDLWTPFFTQLQQHWPDQPFALYLGAGESSCGPSVATVLRSNAGRDWSQCVTDYLGQLPQRHVLLMLDDFFLRRRVDTGAVLRCLAFAQATRATQVRLIPRPGPTHRLPGQDLIGECEAGSPYRLSAQAAIWSRLALRALLSPGESAWQFEHNGNIRAAVQPHGFYSVWRPVLPYQGFLGHHVVEKGKWLPYEKWIFGRLGIGCDFTRRGTLSCPETLLYQAAQGLDRTLAHLPWRARQRVKQRLKIILDPFLRGYLLRMGGVAPPPRSDTPPSGRL